jgi:hypothetical protein
MQELLLLVAQPPFDLTAHLFGDPFDFPRLDLQTGVAEQVLGGLLELGLAARPGHQSAHARRIGGVNDVQLFIVGEASPVALFALIKGARQRHLTQGCDKSLGAPASTTHALAAWTENNLLGRVSLPVSQQVA